MDAIFSANLIGSIGQFLIDFPVASIFAMFAAFALRGEVATLFSVYLAQQGYMSWAKFLIIGYIAIMLQDLIWYFIGKYGRGTRISSWLEEKISAAEKLEKYLKLKTTKALILTKYTIGFGSITILLSGWSKIPFKKFFKINAIADALWFGVMTGLSLILIRILGFFGAREAYDSVGLLLGGLVIVVFLIEYIAQKFFAKSSGIEEGEEITEA